jgi:hypothetical protein
MGLGSGIQKKPIPDPGSRGQKGPGSGSATLLVYKMSKLDSFRSPRDLLYKRTMQMLGT